MRIPSKVKTFKEKSGKTHTKNYKNAMTYETRSGEIVDVFLWHRWPSYDFIFGTPNKKSNLYGIEAGFFQYRDTRKKKVKAGFFIDRRELEILVRGFTGMLKQHKKA